MFTSRDPWIERRVDQLEVPFNAYGIDPYGIDKTHLVRLFTALEWMRRRYFPVRVRGLPFVPQQGRAMLVGNHSGGVAIDATMVIGSAFFDLDTPRLAQGMADKFLGRLPGIARLSSRIGQFAGIPAHAERLLEDDRLLMVFPEGARGTAKLASEADSLVRFGTGFMRLALKTRAPIIPFGFVGGGEAFPTMFNLYAFGRLLGVPYVPVTRYLLPLPKPTTFDLTYGDAMFFEGNGQEDDEVIQDYVEQVKAKIADLIAQGRSRRKPRPLLRSGSPSQRGRR